MPRGRDLTDEPTPTATNGRPTVLPATRRRDRDTRTPIVQYPPPTPRRPKRNWGKGFMRLILWIPRGVIWLFVSRRTPRNDVSSTEAAVTAAPKPTRQWMKPWKWLSKPLKEKKEKKPKKARRSWTSRFVTGALVVLMIIWTFGFLVGRTANQRVTTETSARQSADAQQASQMRAFGEATNFPKADAAAKAVRLATECFTVPNYGAGSSADDRVDAQNKALRNANIPASENLNCGWDGKGRGLTSVVQVVDDPTVDKYWIHGNRATVILQLKLYQRPGFFYLYVPFTSDHGTAKIAGMPTIFGTGSGALDFLNQCPVTANSVDTNPLQNIAQTFLNGLAGDKSIDLGYLVYGDHGDTKFGGFGPAVSDPKVTQVKYCGPKGHERLFAALVQFSGPVAGAHYTLPYGFGVIPNTEISGKYQVKDFGPAPGYNGD